MLRFVAALMLATATADRASTFLIVFIGEALSWAGVPAVGAAAVGAAGVLASQGQIHLWAVIIVGTIGAEVGGLVGWWLGGRVSGSERARGREGGRRDKALTAGAEGRGTLGPPDRLHGPVVGVRRARHELRAVRALEHRSPRSCGRSPPASAPTASAPRSPATG